MTHLTESEFWYELMDDVLGTRSGGAVVIVDAENARKGVGKTSCGVFFARAFSKAFNYQMEEEDLVIAGEAYLDRLRGHPGESQPSVVVWDEAVGGGSGDARRSMAEQNRVMGQAWQLLRTKRIISLVTLPDWNDLDSRLQKLADYRLWCQEKPIGKVKPYKITTPFNSHEVRTRGLGDGDGATPISFPDLKSHDDRFYRHISEKKETLISATGTFDADEALVADGGDDQQDPEEAAEMAAREQAIQTALRAVKPWDDNGMSYQKAAQLVDYSSSWVGNRIEEYREGYHRDLVDVPQGDPV